MERERREEHDRETERRGGMAAQYMPGRPESGQVVEPVVMYGNVRWGAIWAGLVFAFGTQFLFGSLVIAILVTAGRGAVSPNVLGVLIAVVALLSLFAGGWTAGRLARAGINGGIWHSIWLWGLLVIFNTLASVLGISTVLGSTVAPIGAVAVSPAANISAAWWWFIGILAALVGTIIGGWIGGAQSTTENEDVID